MIVVRSGGRQSPLAIECVLCEERLLSIDEAVALPCKHVVHTRCVEKKEESCCCPACAPNPKLALAFHPFGATGLSSWLRGDYTRSMMYTCTRGHMYVMLFLEIPDVFLDFWYTNRRRNTRARIFWRKLVEKLFSFYFLLDVAVTMNPRTEIDFHELMMISTPDRQSYFVLIVRGLLNTLEFKIGLGMWICGESSVLILRNGKSDVPSFFMQTIDAIVTTAAMGIATYGIRRNVFVTTFIGTIAAIRKFGSLPTMWNVFDCCAWISAFLWMSIVIVAVAATSDFVVNESTQTWFLIHCFLISRSFFARREYEPFSSSFCVSMIIASTFVLFASQN